MILPIVAYGSQVLKTKAVDIDKDYPQLDELISNMFETMYQAQGVGLAAPQVGKSIRLFIVDASPFVDEEENDDKTNEQLATFKKVFINPKIIEETGEVWGFDEGCLSIPNIREEVYRNPIIKLNYLDENFIQHEEIFDGIAARIIQHEYDHIEGVLFTDRLSALKRKMLSRKLSDIAKGNINPKYKMKFPILK
jgi:peptide deformylase